MFLIDVLKKKPFFCKILVVNECFFAETCPRATLKDLQYIVHFGLSDVHSKYLSTPFVIVLANLNRIKSTKFPSVLSTGLSLA